MPDGALESIPSDADLMRRSATGDAAAFRLLYDRKHRRVFRVAYRIVGDVGRAEDVAQEVFLALWTHAGSYRRGQSVDAWLNRITANRAIDRWRSERRHPQPAEGELLLPAAAGARESAWQDPTRRARQREVQGIFDRLADALSPQQRAAFVLREIEGLPVAEVADALACSKSTVRSHIALARRALRAGLAEHYPDYLPRRDEHALS